MQRPHQHQLCPRLGPVDRWLRPAPPSPAMPFWLLPLPGCAHLCGLCPLFFLPLLPGAFTDLPWAVLFCGLFCGFLLASLLCLSLCRKNLTCYGCFKPVLQFIAIFSLNLKCYQLWRRIGVWVLQKEEKLLLIEPLNLDCKIYPNSKMLKCGWKTVSLTKHWVLQNTDWSRGA